MLCLVIAFWLFGKTSVRLLKRIIVKKIPTIGLLPMQVQLVGCKPIVGAFFFLTVSCFLGKLF
ncbi:predicted protein [Enterococcus casseliflavus EC10]|nr:predicted protein [Enterococcus casseliflavus EC10]